LTTTLEFKPEVAASADRIVEKVSGSIPRFEWQAEIGRRD
jgi:hypothetical protein